MVTTGIRGQLQVLTIYIYQQPCRCQPSYTIDSYYAARFSERTVYRSSSAATRFPEALWMAVAWRPYRLAGGTRIRQRWLNFAKLTIVTNVAVA